MSHLRDPGDIERHTLAAFDPHHLLGPRHVHAAEGRSIVEDDNDPRRQLSSGSF
jgi:hypothetical protein